MKLLICCHPGYGHLNPSIALAKQLVSAGHHPIIASSAAMENSVRNTNINFANVGLNWSEAHVESTFPEISKLDENSKAKQMEELLWSISPRAVIPDLVDLIERDSPDLVIANGYDWSGALAAEKCGIPYVIASISARIPKMSYELLFWERYQALRREFGLSADPACKKREKFLELSFMPKSWALPNYQAHVNEHFVAPLFFDKHEKSDISWAPPTNGKPLIYVSFGTVTNQMTHLIQIIIEGLKEVNCEVLLSIGNNNSVSHFPSPPSNIQIVNYIPQSMVMPHVKACICHGGVSTTLAALAEGCPLLILPISADQPINANVCLLSGASIALNPKAFKETTPGLKQVNPETLTPEDIKVAIEELLTNPRYSLSAQKVQKEIQALPDISHAIRLIEEVAEQHISEPA